MARRKESNFAVVIHTDSYAGNFERELRGFVTGCSGEHDLRENVTDEIRKHFAGDPDCDWQELDESENPFSGLWRHVRGEYGSCIEEIVNTPARFSAAERMCSVRLHCEKRPTPKQLELIKEWAHKFPERHQERPYANPIKILGFTLESDKVVTVHTEEEF